MSDTAKNLPDDVVERATAAWFERLDPANPAARSWSRHHLAALIDAGIVALVPDPDDDAAIALAATRYRSYPTQLRWAEEQMQRLNAAGWTVARLAEVQRHDPCNECNRGTLIGVDGKNYCPVCGPGHQGPRTGARP